MDEQENRVVPILAADLDPLLDAADLDVCAFLYAVRRADGESFGGKMLAIGPKPQPGSGQNGEDAGQSQQRDPNPSCGLARHRVPRVDASRRPDDRPGVTAPKSLPHFLDFHLVGIEGKVARDLRHRGKRRRLDV